MSEITPAILSFPPRFPATSRTWFCGGSGGVLTQTGNAGGDHTTALQTIMCKIGLVAAAFAL